MTIHEKWLLACILGGWAFVAVSIVMWVLRAVLVYKAPVSLGWADLWLWLIIGACLGAFVFFGAHIFMWLLPSAQAQAAGYVVPVTGVCGAISDPCSVDAPSPFWLICAGFAVALTIGRR